MDLVSAGLGLASGVAAIRAQKHEGRRNRQMQSEFAKHGVRWRVEDAKAAGLHPLYALGANIPTYSPSYSGIGESIQNMGQDVTRAIRATSTDTEKLQSDLQLQLLRSQIKESDARANLLDSQASRSRQTSTPPMGRGLTLPFGTLRTSPTEQSQTIENEYGDVAQEVYGLSRLMNDSGMNFWDAVKEVNPWWYRPFTEESRSDTDRRFKEVERRYGSPYNLK